jgi:plasmid maintenance system killer protein
MSKNTFYIVQYNDCYGNGNNKKIETLVKDEKGFNSWLNQHNHMRILMDEQAEGKNEFDLIPINLFEL